MPSVRGGRDSLLAPLGHWLPRVSLVLCGLALQTGCKEDQPAANLIQAERPFLLESDFAHTPDLAARQHQVIVYDVEPTNAGQTAEDVSRHELEAGRYRYCIETGDPYIQHLSLEDVDGHKVVDLDASSGCLDVQLEAGTYRLRLRHAWSDVGGTHRLAFLHRSNASPTLAGDGGVPPIGWLALAPDDPTGRGRAGRLHAQPPPFHYGNQGPLYQSVEQIVADFSSQHIDDEALFNLSQLGGGGLSDPQAPTLRGGPSPPSSLDLTWLITDEISSAFIASDGSSINAWAETPLQIVDVGSGKFQLNTYSDLTGSYSGMFIEPSDGGVYWYRKPPQLPFMNVRVMFRIFFPADQNYGQAVPGQGEVALYQECNYGGPVTIFATDVPDLSALSGSTVTLDRTTASVRLGSNAAAVLYPATGYGGSSLTLERDTPCLDGTPIQRNTRSLQIQPLLPIFLASSSCEGCNLSGLDLTGVSVSGADLRQANLSGTTLNRTVLHAARSLTGTDFSGASISCSDFSGTDGGVVVLTQTQMFTATFAPDISSCRSNFSNTRVDDAHLNPLALGLLNLTNATIGLSAPLPNWNLQGALWPGATVVGVLSFPGANFQGANLDGVNLSGAQLAQAQMQDAGFRGATLIGVTGLDTAVVTGADFTGASFGGPGLVGALFEQVTLDNATFDAGTDLTGVQFNGSSLQNVDLSGLKLYGAGFVGANLTNSSLHGAFLSNNPDGGSPITPADFTGAHLKDVDLSSAQLQGTIFHFASFYGSFSVLQGPPVFPCETNTNNCGGTPTGFTCSCATAVGAKMIRTDFTNAFLYGVDFTGSGTTINGVDFSNAILVGANFNDATFEVDSSHGGAQPKFEGAWLQGANLGTASLDNTTLANAFVDFEPGGNEMEALLGPSYTGFNGWTPLNQPVCVKLLYSTVTKVPATTGNTTCPDGLVHPSGCGPTPPRPNPNPSWASPIAIGQASLPGYYVNNATYTLADQTQMCRQGQTSFEW